MLQTKRTTRREIASQEKKESITWKNWSTVSIPRQIYFCHEWTTMTSDTSVLLHPMLYNANHKVLYIKSSFSRDYDGDFFKEIL